MWAQSFESRLLQYLFSTVGGYRVTYVAQIIKPLKMPSTSALAVLLMAPITAGFTPTMGILGFPKKVLSKITGGSKQNFLEAKPYYDQSTIPVNTYKAKVRSEKTVRVTAQIHWLRIGRR